MQSDRLKRSALALFVLPAVVQGFMHIPANSIVQGVYAKEFGLDVAAIGVALLVAKLFDAITDPLIGLWSDRHYARGGSRKPFVLGGCLVTAVGVWFLYNPEPGVGIGWFLTWYICAYLGWTITEIPYRAWSLELSNDYAERSKIQGLLAVGLFAGILVFFMIPFASHALGLSPNTEVTSQTLFIAALLTLIFMPLINGAAVKWVPDGPRHQIAQGDGFGEAIRSVRENWPYLYVLLMYLVAGLAFGISQSLGYFFIVNYLQIPDKFALVSVIALPVGLVGPAFFAGLCTRYERHKVLSVAALVAVLPNLYLALWIQPGPDSFLPMTVCVAWSTFASSSLFVIIPALIGDAVDYGILHTGQDRAGTFVAFYTFITKCLGAVGSGVGLLVLGHYGFDASAPLQTPDAQWALRLTYGLAPAVAFASTVPLAWFFPLGRKEHAEIVRQLAERDRASTQATEG